VKVAIIGAGAVGRGIAQLFVDAVLFDEPKGIGTREGVNACDAAFVCVPTPRHEDGSCDTSIVAEVIGWLEAPLIIIRSTVSVGTTRALAAKYPGKSIVFQPEYGPAETPDHPFNDLRKVRWIILGGDRKATSQAIRLWQDVYNADVVIHQTPPETAELCKYMENAFLAMKVAFCNEFFDIAQRFDVDYNELRELWLLDPRIGKSHTFVFPEKRGFGGKCLPKDLDAIINSAEQAGYEPTLLKTVMSSNARYDRGSKLLLEEAPAAKAAVPAPSRARLARRHVDTSSRASVRRPPG
jgi:UDPglucose 6-dehydrogenase